ncbi:F-box only protein 5 [Pleurodeles waltl]|uniref:F-box only protein 5 n=1 Tax=Pleurodeles waltl TaxID=8319 RepID=UPI003709B903
MKCHLSETTTRLSPKKQEPPTDTKLEDFSSQDYEGTPCACHLKEQGTYSDLDCVSARTLDSKDEYKPKYDKENQNVTPRHGTDVCRSLDLNCSESQDDSGYNSILNSDLTEPGDGALLGDISLADAPTPLRSQSPHQLLKQNLPIVCFEEVVCSTLKKGSRRNAKLDWHVVDTMVSQKNFGLKNVIGRKMGLDRMDVLGELFLRDFRHLVAQILRHLSEIDLINVAGVSRTWNTMLTADKWAFPLYLTTLETVIANTAKLSPDAATRTYALRRAALTSVQKAASPKSKSSKKSTRQLQTSEGTVQYSRHAEFTEAAKSLKNDESLRVCVSCLSPAKYDSYTHRATCSRDSCGFDFCTKCHCKYHFSKDCMSSRPHTYDIVRQGPLPGSKKSKQNLRRL